MPAIATSAGTERTTRSERILESIKNQEPPDVGRYAGWGSKEDANAPEDRAESAGPAMLPFLRHRSSDRWWRVGIGFAWIPAIILLITVEDWMNVPQATMWVSLGIFFVVFIGIALAVSRIR